MADGTTGRYDYDRVDAVFTTWAEVYVYADGDIVDTIDWDGAGHRQPGHPEDELLLYSSRGRHYFAWDLTEDFDSGVLPDRVDEIPPEFLTSRISS